MMFNEVLSELFLLLPVAFSSKEQIYNLDEKVILILATSAGYSPDGDSLMRKRMLF